MPKSRCLEQLVLRAGLGCRLLRCLLASVLCQTWHLEVQTWALALLDLVAEITPVRRISVVFDVLPRRSIGQPVFVVF